MCNVYITQQLSIYVHGYMNRLMAEWMNGSVDEWMDDWGWTRCSLLGIQGSRPGNK